MSLRTVRNCIAAVTLGACLAQAQLFTLTKEQLTELTAQNPFERFADGRPKVPFRDA